MEGEYFLKKCIAKLALFERLIFLLVTPFFYPSHLNKWFVPNLFWFRRLVISVRVTRGKRLSSYELVATPVSFLRHTFHGFEDTLKQFTFLGQQENSQSMLAFYADLNNAQPYFTEIDLGDAVIFFREFATVKITVMKVLKKLNSCDDSDKFGILLREQTKKLVEAGERMIDDIPNVEYTKHKDWSTRQREAAVLRVKVKVIICLICPLCCFLLI